MRLLSAACLAFLTIAVSGQLFQDDSIKKENHDYQSDVARMRKIVINSLYSHRDIFLRELISNANDALEKLRLISLTDRNIIDPSAPLNITIKSVTDEDGKGGRLIITDTGIGMSPEEMTSNLGTLAKSGTTDFINRAEQGADSGNLIGSFGLGFYSSFLVADQVYVASIPPKSAAHPQPEQYIFSSNADESAFQIFADPRGNTLGHGTEITLVLKDDAKDLLSTELLKSLVAKHSAFATTYPIWLFTQETEQIPVDISELADGDDLSGHDHVLDETVSPAEHTDGADAEEATLVDAGLDADNDYQELKAPETKSVVVDKWIHLNAEGPLWMRDPKSITDQEYIDFYQSTFKQSDEPLAWHHFQGDSGSGVSFRALIYVPSTLPEQFWNNPKADSKDIRLLVKRVFITNDLGENGIAKWASWLKVIVDADDLPLNVSRETLQSTKFLKQIKQIVVKRLIQLLTRISKEDTEKYQEILRIYGNAIKLGAVEHEKERTKLAGLVRFHTNLRNFTSLDQYLENVREGQKQIFFHAAINQKPEIVAKSIFIEKVHARGYEAFLLTDPLDEFLFTSLGQWQGKQFQDVAKKGLLFGDEKENDDVAQQEKKELEEEFEPLVKWFKAEIGELVRDVMISDRLVTSPCAIVADTFGYSANMERIMNAQNAKKSFMHDFAKKQKFLEINTDSPLILGLLRRVTQLADGEDRDEEEAAELRQITSILIDGALVRSGFDVADSNLFFTHIDHVLRRSLGVSQSAEAQTTVTPAPPIDKTTERSEGDSAIEYDVEPEIVMGHDEL